MFLSGDDFFNILSILKPNLLNQSFGKAFTSQLTGGPISEWMRIRFIITAYITTIKSALCKTMPFESSNQRYQAITDPITQFLCKDNDAFNDVSRPGSRNKNRCYTILCLCVFYRFFLDGFQFLSRTAYAEHTHFHIFVVYMRT